MHDVHCPTSSLIGCICGFSADVFAPQLAGSWVQVQHLQSLNTWVDLTIGVPPNSNGISWNIMEYYPLPNMACNGSVPPQVNGSMAIWWDIPYDMYHIHPIYTQKSIEIPKSDRSFPPHKGTPVFLAGHGSPGRVWLPSS